MRLMRRPIIDICVVHSNLWTLLLLGAVACNSQKTTKSVVITADEEKLRDPEGYAAIAQLHRQMDDDNSGSIDRFESNDFIAADMQFGGSDRARREKAFHHDNDELITVDDLWEAWFAADERSWTTPLVVSWLENSVKLPQYSTSFLERQVDGRYLPRMAVPNSTFLSMTLGIKNPVHRHKIHLKALDVVLFGFSDPTSRMKDIALSILLVVLATVLVLFKRHRSRSSSEMEKLSTKLSQLRCMESDFEDAQHKFEEERKRRQSTNEAAVAAETEQMATLRSKLIEAERLLESSCAAPLALQPLLRRTCELEMSYVGQQRLECVSEMRDAIELIDKLRKKHLSIMASIKLATGASAGTDQVDSKIFSLKARMEKISMAMGECHQRWVEIESLCGFPLIVQPANPELQFGTHATASGGRLPRTPSACSSSFGRHNAAGAATPRSASVASSSSTANTTISSLGTSPGALVFSAVSGHRHGYATHPTVQQASPSGRRQLEHYHSVAGDLHLTNVHRHTHLPSAYTSDSISEMTAPMKASVVKALPSLQREMLNNNLSNNNSVVSKRHSKSSMGSSDSNEDEKENGVLQSSSPADSSPTVVHTSKRTKFHLFRKPKISL